MTTRTPKQLALAAMQGLPDDASVEDAMERLAFLAEIERGLADAEAGRTLSHAEVVAQFSRPSK